MQPFRHSVSPGPEADVSTHRYRHDPYSPDARHFENDVAATLAAPHPATLHVDLWGVVPFFAYPSEHFYVPADAQVPLEGEDEVRIFIGQLPYYVQDMQLNWLCYTFGNGSVVHRPERIMKRQSQGGERLPTGCVHAYCTPRALEELTATMHKKVLVDDTGVWVATTPEEEQALWAYVAELKADRTRRFGNRPYDTVVVQPAHSEFVPRKPLSLAARLQPRHRVNTSPAAQGATQSAMPFEAWW